MFTKELINSLRTLNRAEKLHVMQVLVSGLAQEESELLKTDQVYPVWSPYGATEAAQLMLEVLQMDQSRNQNG